MPARGIIACSKAAHGRPIEYSFDPPADAARGFSLGLPDLSMHLNTRPVSMSAMEGVPIVGKRKLSVSKETERDVSHSAIYARGR